MAFAFSQAHMDAALAATAQPRDPARSPPSSFTSDDPVDDADAAVLALGRWLGRQGYRHVCVTPDTHALVNARPQNARAADLNGVFGWSRPFETGLLAPGMLALLERAQALRSSGNGLATSALRFASLGTDLLAHSAWPTLAADAVFFGPDSYRYAALIEREVGRSPGWRPRRAVDVGCGSGVGALALLRALGADRASELELFCTDINRAALRLARINLALAGLDAHCRFLVSDVLDGVPREAGALDLVLANPPYLLDAGERSYRHGGGALGTGLSLRIADAALERLAPDGRLVLYTAAPVVAGVDRLWQALAPLIAGHGIDPLGPQCRYAELDPDVFGAELAHPAYAEVDRIAVVGLTVVR